MRELRPLVLSSPPARSFIFREISLAAVSVRLSMFPEGDIVGFILIAMSPHVMPRLFSYTYAPDGREHRARSIKYTDQRDAGRRWIENPP